MQLLSQHGSTYTCLSRSVPEYASLFLGRTATNQQQQQHQQPNIIAGVDIPTPAHQVADRVLRDLGRLVHLEGQGQPYSAPQTAPRGDDDELPGQPVPYAVQERAADQDHHGSVHTGIGWFKG